jgi:pilus assembly protein CpaB
MDRRLLTVLGMSVVLALVVAAIFYQVSSHASAKASTPNMKDVVVAVEPLPLGLAIKPTHVKIVKMPVDMYPKTAFGKVDDVLDRSVISTIMADEPLLEGRLAPRGSGMGLAPIIPSGMRAMAVRVNEVIGVAGFILPGMRVDVLVTGRPPTGASSDMTTTVLQNITVLSAGQQMQADSRGQAINATVVNVLVTPEQAQILTLAGNEGRIALILRNATDQKIETVRGHETSELYTGFRKPAPAAPVRVARAAAPKPLFVPPPPPPPPAPVNVPEEIIMIRGREKTVEVVGTRNEGTKKQ